MASYTNERVMCVYLYRYDMVWVFRKMRVITTPVSGYTKMANSWLVQHSYITGYSTARKPMPMNTPNDHSGMF